MKSGAEREQLFSWPTLCDGRTDEGFLGRFRMVLVVCGTVWSVSNDFGRFPKVVWSVSHDFAYVVDRPITILWCLALVPQAFNKTFFQ